MLCWHIVDYIGFIYIVKRENFCLGQDSSPDLKLPFLVLYCWSTVIWHSHLKIDPFYLLKSFQYFNKWTKIINRMTKDRKKMSFKRRRGWYNGYLCNKLQNENVLSMRSGKTLVFQTLVLHVQHKRFFDSCSGMPTVFILKTVY